MSDALPLLKETWGAFQRHKAQWLAAAIAYFTMFAIAPLIIVIVEIAGFFLGGHRSTLNTLYAYLQQDAGKQAADGIQSIVTSTFNQKHGGLAQIISWIVFIVAAIGLFSSIQQALDTVWEAEPQHADLKTTIFEKLKSFAVVLAVAFLLLISLLVTSVLTVAAKGLQDVMPFLPALSGIVDFIVSAAVVTAMFAVLFKYLPDRDIDWKDVWIGAAATGVLFVVGQFLLSWYLGRAGISSTYGAFGGLVVFLIWVNYSAQIMLFGAQFTQVYAAKHNPKHAARQPSQHVATIASQKPSESETSLHITEVRRQMERTREELGLTLDALAYKADVRSRLREAIDARVQMLRETLRARLESANVAVRARFELTSGAVRRQLRRADEAIQTQRAKIADVRPDREAIQRVVRNPLTVAIGSLGTGFITGLIVPSTRVEERGMLQLRGKVWGWFKTTGLQQPSETEPPSDVVPTIHDAPARPKRKSRRRKAQSYRQ